MARVTSPVVSDFYHKLHTGQGVDIRLNTSLDKFEYDEGTSIAVLDNGDRIKFDCAVVGIGVLPNTEFAEKAGLECDNGICVDEFTQTSDPDVYAIGDCSNHPNFIYNRRIRLESVPNAVAQAKTTAAAICDNHVPYDQLPWFWSDQYNIKLQTAGLFQGYDDAVIAGDIEKGKFSVTYLKDNKTIAMDAFNSPAEFMRAKKKIVTDLNS